MTYEPERAPFKLVVLVVVFGWLQIIAQAVISSLTIVWHRSSHVFTSVAIYTLIVVTAIGLDLWLDSNGFMRPDYDLREWLYYTIMFAAGVTLLVGAMVWLSAAVRGILGNYSKLPRIGRS